MKYCLFFLFFLMSHAAWSQLSTTIEWRTNLPYELGDTVFYNPLRKLVWDDFKGKPDHKSIAAAVTSSGFGFALAIKAKNGKAAINISVYCFYNKSSSWVKPRMASAYALLHEQHHFDITYIGTCLFIKKLRAAEFTVQDYSELVDKIYNECYDDLEKMQNDYDGQTKNGQLANIQAEWNKKIDLQLLHLL